MADEMEELIRREHAAKRPMEPFGLFAIQHPAPSVPSSTSEAQADRLTHTEAGRAQRTTQCDEILLLLSRCESGYTRDELDTALGYGLGTICARVRWDLIPTFVDESDEITRPTRRRKPAKVLFITPAGRKRLEAAA